VLRSEALQKGFKSSEGVTYSTIKPIRGPVRIIGQRASSDPGLGTMSFEMQEGINGYKAIAGEFGASDDALQQESVSPIVQTVKGTHWCEEIVREPAIDGYQSRPAGEFGESIKIRMMNHFVESRDNAWRYAWMVCVFFE
jgi:hypothetical protein